MASDEHEQNGGSTLRKLGIPVAISAVGAAIGMALANGPKKGFRETVSDLKDVDLGDAAADLRGKLGAVRGQQEGQDGQDEQDGSGPSLSSDELQQRLQERAKRRAQRRKPARTT
jgi:hypothetical protein